MGTDADRRTHKRFVLRNWLRRLWAPASLRAAGRLAGRSRGQELTLQLEAERLLREARSARCWEETHPRRQGKPPSLRELVVGAARAWSARPLPAAPGRAPDASWPPSLVRLTPN